MCFTFSATKLFIIPLKKIDIIYSFARNYSSTAYLRPGDLLVSPSQNYFAIMQADGNFVVYKGSDPEHNDGAVWSTQTNTISNPQSFLAMQNDGNLVVYRGAPENNSGAVWNSQTNGVVRSYFLIMQDDGNLVIYKGTGPANNLGAIWSIQTGIITKSSSISLKSLSEKIGIPLKTSSYRLKFRSSFLPT